MTSLTIQRRAHIRQLCEQRGVRIEPSGTHAFRLCGPGIYILTTDLALVLPHEVEPPRRACAAWKWAK